MQKDTDTGADAGRPAADPSHRSETRERRAARERGEARRRGLPEGLWPAAAEEALRRTNPAFVALADNVRDYAIFLMDPEGVILYWGEGAHLIKWWDKQEAEGAHLRLLYPEGGSEDGTAEAHLREAAETGEYVGEGQRVRVDGSTFWARVTLTALRGAGGALLGFAKVTSDLTARRAAEEAVAAAGAAHTARDAALAEAESSRAELEQVREEAAFAREQARGAQEFLDHRLRESAPPPPDDA